MKDEALKSWSTTIHFVQVMLLFCAEKKIKTNILSGKITVFAIYKNMSPQ